MTICKANPKNEHECVRSEEHLVYMFEIIDSTSLYIRYNVFDSYERYTGYMGFQNSGRWEIT